VALGLGLVPSHAAWAASIRNVQTGEVSFSTISQTVTLPTALNATNRSLLFFSERANANASDQYLVRGNITNTTTLTFAKNNSGTSVTVRWYVAEFDSGVTVQRGTATQSATTTNQTITAVNLAESFVLVSRERSGTTFSNDDWLRSRLTSTTNLEMALNSGTGNTNDWQVVSFTGASVQRGLLTLASASTSTTQAITAIDTTRSFVLFSYSSPNGTNNNIGQKMVRGWLSHGNQITFDRNNTGVALSIAWEVVQLPAGNSVQEGLRNIASAVSSGDVTISSIDTTRSVTFSGSQSLGGQSWGKSAYSADDNPGVASFTHRFFNSTTLRLERAFTSAATDAAYFVVQFARANRPPVLAAIGPKSVNENVLLTFGTSASDPDGTTPAMTAVGTPSGATYTNNGNGTGTFTWTPTFSQSGVYNVTFIASDGSLADTEIVAITVNNVNRAPVLAAIGPKSVNENVLLTFGTSASDPDGTIPAMTAVNTPTGATYTNNGNGTGTFTWTPTFSQSGVYNVTFIASDGSLADTEIVAITVNNVNRAPVLAAIGPKSVNENVLLTFGTSASDPDGTTPAMTAVGTPSGATYTNNGNGTGTFTWTPTFSQSGVYNVTFIASDGSLADTEIVAITVNNVNRAPVLAAIGPKSVNEGVLLTFGTSASDPDGTTPAMTAVGTPTGATYTNNGNGTGTFTWTPTFAQSGAYNVTFIASDGALADTEIVAITVNNVNRAPVLAAIGPKSVNEGVLLTFGTSASDPDGTTPAMTAVGTPTGATYTNNGNGTGTFTWTPTFSQSGAYNVTFIASDGALADTEIVAITVNNVNQAPVLAAIGPKSVNEGVLLSFGTSATDPDGTIPAMTAVNSPVGATYTNNGNGTGTFTWTPTFAQSGVYNVTFIASDGSLADTEIVAITVNNVNQAPVLAAIGPKSVNEGVLLTFGTSASDPDGTIPAMTAVGTPTGATYTNNGNGTGTFTWTPTFAQSGVYNVTFIASDGSLADTEIVAITVNNVNRAPVLAAIGPKSVNEGVLLTFGTSASDADGTTPAMTAVGTPTGATYTNNGNGTGTFTWTPTFAQSGAYNVTFIASDGALADTEIVVITVNNVNRAPVLAAIGPKSVNEGVLLTFGTSASDPDGTTPAMTAVGTPTGATYTNNGNGTGTFTWTPTFSQSGVYNVTFIASDGALADTEIVAITVNNVNQAPVLATIGPRSVTEGQHLAFSASASDPDGTTPTLVAQSVPANASFADNGNGTGNFVFDPNFTQAGVYNVRFIASDGTLTDTEIVAVTVIEAGNQPPVLAAIGPKSVNEGVLLTFGTSASDPDGTIPTMTAVNSPAGATYTNNGNGTGTFTWTPTFAQSGVYNVTFIASDGSLADTEIVAITVNNINQAPVLAAIGSKSVNEGVLLSFGTSATDPDGTIPTLVAQNSPAGAAFTDNGNGTGTFTFTPTFSQSGVYNVRFIASDGSLADTEIVAITVNNVNQAPILAAIGPKSVNEGVLLSFGTSATDPDGTTPTLVAQNSPAGATFTDNGNGTGTFSFTPTFFQSGVYNVRFIASDGSLADSEIVAITVANVNRAPVLAAIGPKSVNEGVLLSFGVSAADVDSTTPSFIVQGVPTNATFTDNGNGTGSFGFTPSFFQSGVYNVRFIASDGSLTDTELVAITVNNVDRAPVLAAIGPRSVSEGQSLNFATSASDADSTIPVLTAESLPLHATYTDNGNGTGSFTFNPDFSQAGVYNVRFIASDGSLADSEIVAITVTNVNRAPVLAAIGPKSVNEGVNLNFGVSASDPDATPLTLAAQNSPSGATFTDNGNGTGTFNFTPTFSQSGVFNVTFIVSDGALADTEIVAITVNNVNQPPVLATIGPRSVNEGQSLAFGVSATDADGTTPTLVAENTPANASFTDNGNGTGSFTFNPDFTQSGAYNVRFIASDGTLADTEIVAITVNNVNRAPVLAAIGPKSVNEGVLLTFGTSATDPDGTSPTMTAVNSPAGATYTDHGNGTGTFNFTPSFSQSGVYNVTFIASDGALADSEVVVITVNNVNQAPVLAAIGPKSVNEGVLLTFGTSATDPDGTTPTLVAQNSPSGATFVDHANGTGTFSFTPTFYQSGVYNVRFIASDGTLADTEIVAITVNNVNQAPVLAAIGSKSVNEGQALNFGVSASDADSVIPTLVAQSVPTNATFTDNGNGTGSFVFNPDFTQAGVYNVRFIASDGSLADTEIVAITVNNVNRAPVLAAIGPKSVNEGVLLSFAVSAADADATFPSLVAQNAPSGAVLTDNGNGTGTFNFTPTFHQSGVYNVTFIASDGALADTEIVAITVNNVNQAPVLAAIGPKSVNEGQSLNFGVSASDADSTVPTLVAQNVLINATFTDNGNGTGSFVFNPDFTQAGVFNVTFIASDGSLADTEIVAITVNNVNRAPVLAAIGPKSVNENVNLNFGASASDPDGTIPTLVVQNAPLGSTFTDNGNGTGTFNWTPDFTQSGVHNVRFIASDGSLTDTEVVAITVNNVNRPPVLAAISPKSVNEGVLLTFGTSASDPDATPLTLVALNSPAGATFTDNGNGTGTFNFTPTFFQSGAYNVTFIVSDGSLADSEIVTITVNNVNRAPVLAAIGPKSVNEGVNLSFGTSASDADSTIPTLVAQNTPSGATFTDNGNGTGSFSFTPTFFQSGVYNVRFIASDGSLTDTEIVAITVNNVNRAPVLASIGPKSVNENVNLNFGVSATDADSTIPTLVAQNAPAGATFTDNGNGSGTFNFTPTFAQSGVYNVSFIASDGSLADTEIVVITVNNVNRPPVLAAIGPKSVNEGQSLNFGVSGSDPDATPLTLVAQGTPANATFTDNGNGTGTFVFNPDYTQSGIYNVRFIVSDGSLADSEIVAVTVVDVNRPPVLAAIGPKSVNEGQNLNFNISATDPELTIPTLTAQSVPTNATFTDHGNGTGTFNFNPSYIQSGVYNVLFIASDGLFADSELVAITVNQVNLPPVLAAIGPRSVTEGQVLNFATSATDPDATIPALTAENVPSNATYVDNGNGTGSFSFSPSYVQSGAYNVRFIASDGSLADTELVTITVNEAGNQSPILDSIRARSVTEGQTLVFRGHATDPEGAALTLFTSILPSNAVFVDSGNGAGSFTFSPNFTQSGTYFVTFAAQDPIGAVDNELVRITVIDAGNQAPVLAAIGPRSVQENATLTFNTSATDPDGTTPTLSAVNLPAHATFTNNGNGTGTFQFNAAFGQAGVYNVTFIASDGALADSEIVAITVGNVNEAPILAAIGPKSVSEGVLLSFGVSATDPDGTTPALLAQNTPSGATFTDNGNGTGSFSFTPTFSQSGVFNVRFIATDGALSDTEIVAITVNNVNRAPVLAAIGPKSVNEGVLLSFGTSASDPDSTTLTMTALNRPAGATYTDNGNGTATFSFTPTFAQSGVYSVTFIASDGSLADTEIVAITVNNVNQAPVLAAIGPKSVNEGVLLTFGTSATDPDGTTPTMTAQNTPAGAAYTDNGNGTATFSFTPTFAQSGVYNVRFIASDGTLADTEIVAITVNNVNQAPVLAAIGPKSVNEGVLLTFGTSATDPDGTTPAMTAQNSPAGATYSDNGNGTGTFSFTPTFSQSGVYNVRFIASDGSLADTEIVAITVGNVNQAPVLAAIGPKSVNEGVLLTFGTSASDPDGTTPTLTTVNRPAGATYTDNGNGTGTFSFTPTFAQSGVYSVTFIASDGALADSEIVAITVNNVNQAPVLAVIGPKSVNEGVLLTFGTSASDPDGTTPAMTAQNTPAGSTYTDNGNGTGTFSFTPTFAQSGVYNVRFIASDGALADTEIVAITVNNVNQPPVLAAIGPKFVAEGVLLTFGVSASDVDGTIPALVAQNAPSGATFTDNGNGTGTFNFTPSFVQAGVYNVRFIASDGTLADSEIVAVTVNDAGNQAPVLAAIGPRSVTEGQILNFNISATDADGTTPSFVAQNVPANATFTDNGNGTGSFHFAPSFVQAGVYNVRFIASDGTLADSEVVAITVNEAGNQAPVLAAIGPRGVIEGQNLNFNISATDPDGTTPTFIAQSVPTHATFTDNGNGTGTFNFNPDFTQAGVYNVRFIASDGTLADSELVTITVNSAGNQAPVLAAIGPRSVNENANLNFNASATDPDATTPILIAQSLPLGATFNDNGNGTGTFDWTPSFSQSGVYNVRFIATDGSLADTEIVAITVNNVNRPPVLAAIGPKSVNEGVLLTFGTSATDPDGQTPTLVAQNSPSGATFTDNGNGTGTFSFTPTFSQSGVYNVTFITSDGSLADSEIVAITVNNVNLPPVLAAIGPKSVTENVLLTFGVSATDPDPQTLTLLAQNSPLGATFTDNGNGTGTFSFTPTFSQSGVYNVRFIASDGTLADSEIVAITVNNVNQAPVLAAIGPKSVNEGVLLSFGTSASDPDGTIPTLVAQSAPVGATFTDHGNGTGTFNWTPDFTQSGVYNVRFIASDGALADTELIAITVINANAPPVLATIGPRSVTEGANLNFNISATDVDGTIPTLTAGNVPARASFVDNGNGTGTFNFNPDFTQAGVYNVRFVASDGTLADTEIVAITVVNAGNQAPVLAAIGPRSVNENANLHFNTSATDADSTIPILLAQALPSGATFTDNGNGTGTFDWTPSFTQSGVYNVRFIATDGALADTEIVAVTVNNVNRPPVLAAIGPKSVNEGVLLTFGTSASDPDLTPLTLVALNSPSGATFTDNGNGTGSFSFTPNFTQSGVYNVTFITSDGTLADSEIVAITVNNVNLPPVLAAIGPRSVNENVLLTFGVSATDPDPQALTLVAQNSPAGATFIDNGNGTGTFNFTPTFSQSGVYNVRFIVSDGSLADTEIVAITVNDVNRAPVLAAIGPRSVNENANLSFNISASDPDATIPSFVALNVPLHATFTNNGNGTGTFNFNPDFTQSGVYNVTFITSDGSLADSEVVAITVNNVNAPPVLAAIGPRSVAEGANLSFNVSASDVDGTTPALTAGNVPANATFTDNGNGTGTFNFNPNFTQSGLYNVRFVASDGLLADTEIVAITVNDAGNQAPVLAAIGPRSVNENANLHFNISATDLDATTPILIAQNLPSGSTFNDNGNGTGTLDWTPSFTQAGVYNVRFIATDGSLADSEIVAITVNNVNRPPVLAAIGPKSVNEGVLLTFGTSASDPDLTPLTLVALNSPSGATFIDNGNGTGTFSFTPNFTQSGVYNVTFIASDGSLSDSEIVAITVNNVNLPPVLATIGPKSVNENVLLTFGVSATDPDPQTLTLVAQNSPVGATFTDNGNGTGTFSFTPTFSQSGVYNVRFIVSDGALADTEIVAITVNDVNRAPVLAAIGPRSVNENANLNFAISASDPDATIPTLVAQNVPTHATFVDNGNGTGTFNFNPDFTQSGIYSVTFIASDGSLADTEIVAITVNNVNAAPILAAIGPRSVVENANLNFNVSATDVDGTTPSMSAVNVPTHATFTDNGNGTGTFNFNPDFTQSGIYNVTFIASDGSLADSEIVTITVTDNNRAPVANAGADQGPVAIGFVVALNGTSSSDPDNDVLTYHWRQLSGPAVTFIDSTSAISHFTPLVAGTYAFRLIVSDAALSSNPDTTLVAAVSQPRPITDLMAAVAGNAIQLTWSPISTDTSGSATTLARYVVYRGTRAYYTPTAAESIGVAVPAAVSFTDNNSGGADVVGDTSTNYFYCLQAVDAGGGRSAISNRVGEYDYQIYTTSTTDFTLIMLPFANTGIATAADLIQSIGVGNVNTVNRFIQASQSYESRFAAGFGPNFPVVPGGIYQVNAKFPTVWTIAGRVPAPGTISYPIVTTSTTDFSFIGVPFEHELDFTTAQSVINSLPGVFNTLNRFIPTSQSYESRFAAGFGPNFTVKAGRVYQANAASAGTFPAP
jgi:uncharacterized protein (UPF0179 family)